MCGSKILSGRSVRADVTAFSSSFYYANTFAASYRKSYDSALLSATRTSPSLTRGVAQCFDESSTVGCFCHGKERCKGLAPEVCYVELLRSLRGLFTRSWQGRELFILPLDDAVGGAATSKFRLVLTIANMHPSSYSATLLLSGCDFWRCCGLLSGLRFAQSRNRTVFDNSAAPQGASCASNPSSPRVMSENGHLSLAATTADFLVPSP